MLIVFTVKLHSCKKGSKISKVTIFPIPCKICKVYLHHHVMPHYCFAAPIPSLTTTIYARRNLYFNPFFSFTYDIFPAPYRLSSKILPFQISHTSDLLFCLGRDNWPGALNRNSWWCTSSHINISTAYNGIALQFSLM